MKYAEKLKNFFIEVLTLPFRLMGWYLGFGFSALFGLGTWVWALVWGSFVDQKGSYFFKPNRNYGEWRYYSYTDKIQKDIYDNEGNKIGSYETDGETHSGWDKDTDEYKPRYILIFLFMPFFSICMLLSLVANFFSLFTNKYYVSRNLPSDYNPVKYVRALYCFFYVVVERSEEKQNRIIRKREKKEKERIKKMEEKENKKLERKRKREENADIADQRLGIILKIIGALIAIFIILTIVGTAIL